MAFRSKVLVLATALVRLSPVSSSKASLFELVEDVTELNPQTFAAAAESKHPWVLNCYSPGCMHCIRFKPTWEKVATALRYSTVQVGAVNCIKHSELCRSFPVPSYPTIMALNSPGDLQGSAAKPALKKVGGGGQSFEGILELVEAEFAVNGAAGLSAGAGAAAAGGAIAVADAAAAVGLENNGLALGGMVDNAEAGAPCLSRIEDATVSVRYLLKFEVFTQGEKLDNKRMGALLSFLDLLSTTFPGKSNRASFRSLAGDLRRDPGLNNARRWDKRIAKFRVGSFVPGNEFTWPAANIETGSKDNDHFTSGLWSLFHALSVSTAPLRQNPYAIMEGMHSFVENFFRPNPPKMRAHSSSLCHNLPRIARSPDDWCPGWCQHCRSHFLEMYEACENGRCTIPKPSNMRGHQSVEAESALALWMWRMHNAVNTAVHADRAGDGDQKVEPFTGLWPSAKVCQDCWGGFPRDDKQPPWSETEVLKYVKRTYSCPEAVGEGTDAPGHRWVVTCVVVCAGAAVVMWVRRWVEMRGIGLNKKRVDAAPGLTHDLLKINPGRGDAPF